MVISAWVDMEVATGARDQKGFQLHIPTVDLLATLRAGRSMASIISYETLKIKLFGRRTVPISNFFIKIKTKIKNFEGFKSIHKSIFF